MNKKLKKLLQVYLVIGFVFFIILSCNQITGTDVLKGSDDIPPVLTITSPAEGDYYRSIVNVSGSVSDLADLSSSLGEIKSITWELTGTALGGEITIQDNGSFSFDFPTAGLTGTITLKLTAVDWNDNSISETVQLTAPRLILSFSFLSEDNNVLSQNIHGVIRGTDITVDVPEGTDISSLAATFDFLGVSVKVSGTDQESGVTMNDFREPVEYIVASNDGETATYTVTINETLRSDDLLPPEITVTSHSEGDPYDPDVLSVTGTILDFADTEGTSGQVESASWEVTGTALEGEVVIGDGGAFSFNFPTAGLTGTITLKLTAVDWNGNSISETVQLTAPKEITSFNFLAEDNPVLAQNLETEISGTDITADVPEGTDISGLVATFNYIGVSIKVDGTEQESGVTANDFRESVQYVVASNDGGTVTYTVFIDETLRSDDVYPPK